MQTLDDAVLFLRQVIASADGGAYPERYGIFARAYLRMTLQHMLGMTDRSYEDPPWMATFTVAFVERYQLALSQPELRPQAWAAAFQAAAQDDGAIIRHLLLGINAHMAFDLAVVVSGLPDARRRSRDFDAVNQVIALAIDGVKEALEARYAEWLTDLDEFAGWFVNSLSETTFTAIRSGAFADGVAIRDGRMTVAQLDAKVGEQAGPLALVPF